MAENKAPGTMGDREKEVMTHVEPEVDSKGKPKSVEENVKTEKELGDSDKYPD